MTELRIPGRPYAQERHRTGNGRTYNTQGTIDYRRAVWAVWTKARYAGAEPLEGPFVVEILCLYRRPKSRPKSVPLEAWATGRRVFRPGRPDLDNLAKAVLDALQAAGAFKDDGQCVELSVRKAYTGHKEAPATLVTVRGLGAFELEG